MCCADEPLSMWHKLSKLKYQPHTHLLVAANLPHNFNSLPLFRTLLNDLQAHQVQPVFTHCSSYVETGDALRKAQSRKQETISVLKRIKLSKI